MISGFLSNLLVEKEVPQGDLRIEVGHLAFFFFFLFDRCVMPMKKLEKVETKELTALTQDRLSTDHQK
jgi:hypothetical protein